MKTVAVVTSKGGSGKTTIAINLAIEAWLRGERVLLADLDPQHSSLLALKTRRGEGPGSMATTGGKLFQLQQTAQSSGVDMLVIDTPGGASSDVCEAIRLADLSVVVSRPTFFDLAAAVATADTVRRVGRKGLAVLNQAPPPRRGVEPAMVSKALIALGLTGLEVAPVAVRTRAAHQAAVMNGQGVMEYDPRSAAAAEIAALWNKVAAMLSPPPMPIPRPAFLPLVPAVSVDLSVLR